MAPEQFEEVVQGNLAAMQAGATEVVNGVTKYREQVALLHGRPTDYVPTPGGAHFVILRAANCEPEDNGMTLEQLPSGSNHVRHPSSTATGGRTAWSIETAQGDVLVVPSERSEGLPHIGHAALYPTVEAAILAGEQAA